MNEIKSITIVNNPGVKQYFADEKTAIVDKSKVYPDHTEFVFHVIKNNALIAEIINCPVEITY